LYAGTMAQTDYGFTGEPFDATSGLVYLRSRHYRPANGTFTSRDPFEGTMSRPMSRNGYSWVEGRVADDRDPSGMICLNSFVARSLPQFVLSPANQSSHLPCQLGSLSLRNDTEFAEAVYSLAAASFLEERGFGLGGMSLAAAAYLNRLRGGTTTQELYTAVLSSFDQLFTAVACQGRSIECIQQYIEGVQSGSYESTQQGAMTQAFEAVIAATYVLLASCEGSSFNQRVPSPISLQVDQIIADPSIIFVQNYHIDWHDDLDTLGCVIRNSESLPNWSNPASLKYFALDRSLPSGGCFADGQNCGLVVSNAAQVGMINYGPAGGLQWRRSDPRNISPSSGIPYNICQAASPNDSASYLFNSLARRTCGCE